MNYPHIWDRLWNKWRWDTEKGFILPSLLISLLLGLFIISVVLSIVATTSIWRARLDDSVSMIEDGRYTRRAIVGHVIWNPYYVSVEEDKKLLSIHDEKRTAFIIERRALYRKLSDGSLQPMSGSRIIGTVDKRKVDGIAPFVIDDTGALHLSWTVNNRFTTATHYAKGYGGIASYEIKTIISTHHNWYSSKEEL